MDTVIVSKVNEILAEMGLNVTFSFACFDLKSYVPFLTLKRGAEFYPCISCQATEDKEVRFYFMRYPKQEIAKSYDEYLKNREKIEKWNNGINTLNALHVKIPEYK